MGSDGAAGLVLTSGAKARALGLHVIANSEAMRMQSRSFGSINLQLLFKNAQKRVVSVSLLPDHALKLQIIAPTANCHALL